MSADQQADDGTPFTAEEQMFRRTVRSFLDRELEPHYKAFEASGELPRSFWRKAGAAGILGPAVPEQYGGPGASPVCHLIVAEEMRGSIGGAVVGSSIILDMTAEIVMSAGSEAQKAHWGPRFVSGNAIPSLGLTEPGAGSDATAITTTAVRDGDDYVINGSKIYITNGLKADIIIVIAKTDPAARGRGMSAIIVTGQPAGLTRSRLKTMGHGCEDVAELHFDNVRVPAENLIGGEGGAMAILMQTFALERLSMGAGCIGAADLAFRLALDYVKDRKAFGQSVFDFQGTQWKLAEMKADMEAGRALYHEGVRKYRRGGFSLADGAIIKLWMSEMEGRVIDGCLQLFGGAGYMDDMPISRLYTAARVQRIFGGTSELQKIAIARTL
jgi:alkylation response protein AidB-like acyl-CoA dehydrogenase